MPDLTAEAQPTRQRVKNGHTAPRITFALILGGLALLYAFLGGFHTTDFDTGWHLATGRFVLQHHYVPTTDQFSYTAHGAEWIYPPATGIVFYLLYSIGGWAALSWLTAIACVAAIVITLRDNDAVTNTLAIIAVPAIAYRTVARADLFNTVLFAAMLHVMWSYYRGRESRPWLFPILMLLWANFHLGFVAGLGMLIGYIGVEVLELPFADRRGAAMSRLRKAWPWILLSFPATLLNPFGWKLYLGLLDQPLASKSWNYLIGEFARPPLPTVWQALDWRDPQTSFWWLMAIAAVAVIVAVSRKQFGAALFLTGAAYVSLSRARFQAMFALVVIVVAGEVLGTVVIPAFRQIPRERLHIIAAVIVCLFAVFVGIRGADLVTDSYYVRAADPALFGAGPSWWYPERAAEFVLREHLPGKILNDFNNGAYLMWKLGPDYPVYIDNRAMPFGVDLMFHQQWLAHQPPDSAAWRHEADKYGINTILLSAARYGGLSSFPLTDFCASKNWRPVYLDDVAAVFLRNTPENVALIERLQIDCAKVAFEPPPNKGGYRGRAELFQFDANSAAILYVLGRDSEAWAALRRAQELFPDDAGVHLAQGQLYQAHGQLDQAEREYRESLRLKETSVGWNALGMLLASEKRWDTAAKGFDHAARIDVYPHRMYLQAGEAELAMGDAHAALATFEKARATDPFVEDAAPFGAEFNAELAEATARAYTMLGDSPRAATYTAEAQRARQQAEQLQQNEERR
jgi:tetratricopeptide (TPR) repeat protein